MKYKSQAIILPAEVIEKKIFLIRGEKVMIDSHLAEIYGVSTKALVQAVKRNPTRFPIDFAFQLNTEGVDPPIKKVTCIRTCYDRPPVNDFVAAIDDRGWQNSDVIRLRYKTNFGGQADVGYRKGENTKGVDHPDRFAL